MTGPTDWARLTASALRKKRAALLRQLPALEAILRGTLLERYKRCGKPGCRCVDGPGHGPKFYLSVSRPGARPEMQYIPLEHRDQVAQLVENYREARAVLDQICEVNLELLRRREELE